jgi:hypothetical protein
MSVEMASLLRNLTDLQTHSLTRKANATGPSSNVLDCIKSTFLNRFYKSSPSNTQGSLMIYVRAFTSNLFKHILTLGPCVKLRIPLRFTTTMLREFLNSP